MKLYGNYPGKKPQIHKIKKIQKWLSRNRIESKNVFRCFLIYLKSYKFPQNTHSILPTGETEQGGEKKKIKKVIICYHTFKVMCSYVIRKFNTIIRFAVNRNKIYKKYYIMLQMMVMVVVNLFVQMWSQNIRKWNIIFQ